MPAARVVVSDLRPLKQALRRVRRDLPRLIIAPALHKVASTLYLPQVVEEIPRRSGELRGTARARRSQDGARVAVGYKRRGEYAGVIHYGWPGHNIEPNRFFDRAARQVPAQRAVQLLTDEVARGMTRAGVQVD